MKWSLPLLAALVGVVGAVALAEMDARRRREARVLKELTDGIVLAICAWHAAGNATWCTGIDDGLELPQGAKVRIDDFIRRGYSWRIEQQGPGYLVVLSLGAKELDRRLIR